jgi:hypothetical protein
MKKLIVVLLSFFALQVSAQKFPDLDKSVMDVVYYPNGAHRVEMIKEADKKAELMPKIRITYSRPLANGRVVFGDLIKYNEPWRLGANESTEVIFYTAVRIGNDVLSPGRYSLYCIPTADSWTLKVHPSIAWGVYGFDFTKDLASVTAKVSKSNDLIEALSMTMYKAENGNVMLKVGWDKTIAEFPITLL